MCDHVRRCTWERDDEGNWATGCGERFCLNDGTPSENNMRFCCYCGGKLREAGVAIDLKRARALF